MLTVVTRARSVGFPLRSARFVGTVGRDRFAINGGFGWYGWFRVDGRTVRAFVTDPACAVLVETGGVPVLVSPADGAAAALA